VVIDVADMEGLPANAGINTVTNCINGLKNVISSHKSGEMAFLYEKFYVKIEQIATRTLNKMGGIVKYF
jgi:hypothetical protein